MINFGIICPSEIAFRRFLPALEQCKDCHFIGVAFADKEEYIGATDAVLEKEYEKALTFVQYFGGKVYNGYHKLIDDSEVDAIYLPLPPALHFPWASRVIDAGKHAFVEKPCTTRLADTESLISIARDNHLALHENYMFVFHRQMSEILRIIDSGQLGEVRLVRIDFGFPIRSCNDFRYKKALGGGALFDCAGYTMRCASFFLGDTARVVYGKMNTLPGYEVDMFGSATMVNNAGVVAQLSWGMDNNYRCDLDIWGSAGSLHTNRVLTAPVGFEPFATLRIGNSIPQEVSLGKDDAFLHSIMHFGHCIENKTAREENYHRIYRQALLIDEFMKLTQ